MVTSNALVVFAKPLEKETILGFAEFYPSTGLSHTAIRMTRKQLLLYPAPDTSGRSVIGEWLSYPQNPMRFVRDLAGMQSRMVDSGSLIDYYFYIQKDRTRKVFDERFTAKGSY